MADHDKKEGFGYISPELQKKNAFIILRVEFVVIIAVVVLIFGILNYFLIFPLSIMNPKLFGWLPTKSISPNLPPAEQTLNPETQKGQSVAPTVKPTITITIDKAPSSIKYVSDIPQFSIKLNQKDELERLLQEWNVYFYLKSFGLDKKLDNVVIHLTDKEQADNKISSPKAGVFLSSDIKGSGGTSDIYIGVAESVLNDPKSDKSAFFQSEFLRTMYNISHSAIGLSEQEARSKSFSTLMTTLRKNNKVFFIIEKK
jgi:hypothetical protein